MKNKILFLFLALFCASAVCTRPAYGQNDAVQVSSAGAGPAIVESKTEPGAYFIAYKSNRYGKDTTVSTWALRLQKVRDGQLLWANEVTVADKYTGGGAPPFSMIPTADGGCAFLYYHRERWGEDPTNAFVYKVDANGNKLWEHQLSAAENEYVPGFDYNGDVAPNPATEVQSYGASRLGGDLVELPGGEIVVTWANENIIGTPNPSYNLRAIWIATIAKNGTVAKAEERIGISGSYPNLTIDPANPDQFFMVYATGNAGAYNISMAKYQVQPDGTFSKVWTTAANIHDRTLVYTLPDLKRAIPDGEGGALVCYHAKRTTTSSAFNAYFNYVTSAGQTRWNSPGIQIATNSNKSYMGPLFYYYKPRETVLFAWREGLSYMSNYGGVGMQRLDMVAGDLEWGAAGKTVIEPTYNLTVEPFAVSIDEQENPSYLYGRSPLGSLNTSSILLKKLDLTGFEDVAPADEVLSPVSQKFHHTMFFSKTSEHRGIVVWVDKNIIDSEGPVYAKEFTY